MTLDIISQSLEDRGRAFRQYQVEGINTIGVFGDEPFSIRFANDSWQRVQVKLSLDGTDILTGNQATLDEHERMWVIEPRTELNLQAWPESRQGGARFAFTTVENSVAAHTHGDLTAKGIISAAVFVEGYRPPVYHTNFESGIVAKGARQPGGFESASPLSPESTDYEEDELRGPAIGAGEYVEQHLKTTRGLIQPVYSHLVRVRYLWWDDLVRKLQSQGVPSGPQYPTGFSGGHLANLGNTPRLGGTPSGYSRFQ